MKDIGQNDLVAALKALALGDRLISPPPRPPDKVGLSRQEQAHLAPNTVKTYWQSALGKLNARNRAEAITHAHDAGLL